MDGRDHRDRGARVLLIAACVVIVIAGLQQAGSLILPLLVAIFLAILCLPLMGFLRRFGMPLPVAVPSSVVSMLFLLGGMIYLASGSAATFVDKSPVYKQKLDELRSSARAELQEMGVQLSDGFLRDHVNSGAVVDFMSAVLSSVTSLLSSFFLVLLLLCLILFEAAHLPHKIRLAMGERTLDKGPFDTIMGEVQSYFGIKIVVGLATGIILGGWVGVCGVDFFFLWGLVAFLLNFIPNIGSVMAAIGPVMLAIIQYGFARAALVAAGYVVVNVVIGNFIEPRMMGRRLGLSTLVVFLSLIFWGWVWGPVGMLLSVPLTMFVKILLENTDDLKWIAVLLSSEARLEDGQ